MILDSKVSDDMILDSKSIRQNVILDSKVSDDMILDSKSIRHNVILDSKSIRRHDFRF